MEQPPTPARILTGLTAFLHEGRTYIGVYYPKDLPSPWM